MYNPDPCNRPEYTPDKIMPQYYTDNGLRGIKWPNENIFQGAYSGLGQFIPRGYSLVGVYSGMLQRHSSMLLRPIQPVIPSVDRCNGGGFVHRWRRNGTFYLAVGPITGTAGVFVSGLKAVNLSRLSCRHGLCASLIGSNPHRLIALYRWWAPSPHLHGLCCVCIKLVVIIIIISW